MERWKPASFYFWESTPLFKVLLPLILSIICFDAQVLPHVELGQLCMATGSLAAVTFLLHFFRNFQLKFYWVNGLLFSLVFFLAGWAICVSADVKRNPEWLGKRLENATVFDAVALEEPSPKEKTWKVTVELRHALVNDTLKSCTGKALVYFFKGENEPAIKPGDVLLLPNKWDAVKNAGNPFEFDYAQYLARKNIFFQQFLSLEQVKIIPSAQQEISVPQKLHQWGLETVSAHVKDSTTLGILQAMLLGDDRNFDPQVRQTFSETGIVHIVAISGAHIGFFFLMVRGLFFWIRKKRYEWMKNMIAIPFIWLYVLVAGCPVSAVRAAIMFTLLGFGMMVKKDRNPLNILFAAALIMLLADPQTLYATGFQLSFMAVLSLLLFYNKIAQWFYIKNKVLKFLWSVAAASIAAEILIAPVIAFYFHLFPLGFIVANLLAYGFLLLMMYAGFALLAFSWLPLVPDFLGFIATIGTGIFSTIMDSVKTLNPDAFRNLQLSLQLLLLLFAIIMFTSLFAFYKKPKMLVAAFVLIALFTSLMILNEWQALHQEKLIVYNDKNGYAEIIRGKYFQPVSAKQADENSVRYFIKNTHDALHAWRKTNDTAKHLVYKIAGQSVGFLHENIKPDSSVRVPLDYLILDYPVKNFQAMELQQMFRFKKLIVSSQKRYKALQWQDSCLKHHIPVHFTQFDGAFVLSN